MLKISEKPQKRKAPDKPSEHRLVDYPDYVKAIGLISIETVDLELHLADLFARMLGISYKIGRAIYLSPKAEHTRLDIFANTAHAFLTPNKRAKPDSALSKQKRKALRKIKNLLERSRKLINKRHRVIHDDWDISQEEKKVTRRRVDGKSEHKYEPISHKELDAHIRDLRVLIDDIYDLTQDFRKHPPHMVDLRIS